MYIYMSERKEWVGDDLRDISRDIREIITCSNNQTSSTLLIRRSGIMNDLSLCSVDRIRR